MDLLTELTRANHDPAVIEKVRALMEQSAKAEQVLAKKNATLAEKDFKIVALTLELAYYRRINYGKKSESFSGEQRELFEETIDSDLAAIHAELAPPDTGDGEAGKRKRSRAGRQPLPAELPRVEHRHEP
ncbi:transposase domain-containing protein, partial [Massilia sp. TWR1-2-2]|uniref:transposase domain-containing protein n=1 Tax=Massilia sp. TWR1-2-2 TaxID=2804584 RepID=UPI003CEF29EE